MLVSLISLLLLVVAAYFLVKTQPYLFLFELMKGYFCKQKAGNVRKKLNRRLYDEKIYFIFNCTGSTVSIGRNQPTSHGRRQDY